METSYFQLFHSSRDLLIEHRFLRSSYSSKKTITSLQKKKKEKKERKRREDTKTEERKDLMKENYEKYDLISECFVSSHDLL